MSGLRIPFVTLRLILIFRESLTAHEMAKGRLRCMERFVPLMERALRDLGDEPPSIPAIESYNEMTPVALQVSWGVIRLCEV